MKVLLFLWIGLVFLVVAVEVNGKTSGEKSGPQTGTSIGGGGKANISATTSEASVIPSNKAVPKQDNRGVYRRSMIFVGVLLGISLCYFLLRTWRSHRRKQRLRRYGGRKERMEMTPIETCADEDSA